MAHVYVPDATLPRQYAHFYGCCHRDGTHDRKHPLHEGRNAGPVTVIPVGLLEIKWMGLWPSSEMLVALKLPESKWLWMGTRSTTTMIAICSAFRRPSGSMRTIDIAAVLHRKEAHEEKTEDHYHGHAGEVFPELARTSIATDRFVLLSRPSSTHKINK